MENHHEKYRFQLRFKMGEHVGHFEGVPFLKGCRRLGRKCAQESVKEKHRGKNTSIPQFQPLGNYSLYSNYNQIWRQKLTVEIKFRLWDLGLKFPACHYFFPSATVKDHWMTMSCVHSDFFDPNVYFLRIFLGSLMFILMKWKGTSINSSSKMWDKQIRWFWELGNQYAYMISSAKFATVYKPQHLFAQLLIQRSWEPQAKWYSRTILERFNKRLALKMMIQR